MEHLYDKLVKYSVSDYYGFHMPGHKRQQITGAEKLPYEIDITEIEGFDDLHHAEDLFINSSTQKTSEIIIPRFCIKMRMTGLEPARRGH